MLSLNLWRKPNSDQIRLYINGTTRRGVYIVEGKDGTAVWSSKANDTPHRFQTGDHYGKVRKDGDAARMVAAAYGVTLGKDGDPDGWTRLLAAAEQGLEVEEPEL